MKAITTTYRGATNRFPGRYTAKDGDNHRAGYSDSSGLEHSRCHLLAAAALVQKMNWAPVILAEGGTRDANVYVMLPATRRLIEEACADGERVGLYYISENGLYTPSGYKPLDNV